jgi:hypothetical protein
MRQFDKLCYFDKLSPIATLKLLYAYFFCNNCYDCELWGMNNNKINMLNVSWRRSLKNIRSLFRTTHPNVIYDLCGKYLIEVDILMRYLKISFQCISNENYLVPHTVCHSLSFLYMLFFD